MNIIEKSCILVIILNGFFLTSLARIGIEMNYNCDSPMSKSQIDCLKMYGYDFINYWGMNYQTGALCKNTE